MSHHPQRQRDSPRQRRDNEHHDHPQRKRQVLPDPKFGDEILSRFMNVLMYDGKKSAAEKNVYGALRILQEKKKLANDDAVKELFHELIRKCEPQVEVRSRRVGGATYQVPVEVRTERARALAMRWIITFARKRGENTMIDRLAGELLDAANDRGNAVKKRDDTHKMAEANKAFAHYRW